MNFNLAQSNFGWGRNPFMAFFLIICLVFGSVPAFAVETGQNQIVTQPKPGKPIIPSDKDGESSKRPTDAIPSAMGSLQALVIPEAFGTIKEIFKGSEKETLIFHIQDVHANYEVQENIAKIIDHINRNYFSEQIDFIGIEGAKGKVDLSLLKSVPERKALKETTQYLLRDALLTGAEYYSTFYQKRAEVYGVEDAPLYFSNWKAFRDTVRLSEETEQTFKQFENSFYQLLGSMASEELKELYERKAAYEKNKLPLSQFSLYLNQLAKKYQMNVKVHPNFKTVLDALDLEEKIDFDKLGRQQSQLIKNLQRLENKEVTSTLIQSGLDYRTGKIPAHTYYRLLIDLAQNQNMEPKKDYAELFKYGRLTYLQSRIKASVLFKELDWIVEEIKSKMLVSQEEVELDQIKQGFEVLNSMRELKLTRSQWEEFSKDKSDFNLEQWRQFILAQASKRGLTLNVPENLASLQKMLSAPERFYKDALARDEVIVKNFFQAFTRSGKKVAVLVTGGFHTEGILQQIKAKDVSYVVITPRMTQDYDDTLYIQRMMGEEFALALPVLSWSDLLDEILKSIVPYEGMVNQVRQAVIQRMLITLGLLELTSEDKSQLDRALVGFEEKFKVRRVAEGWVEIQYTAESGERMRSYVRNRSKDESKRDFVATKPEKVIDPDKPTEEPKAFQAGLAESLIGEYGLSSENVTSSKGTVEITKGNEAPGIEALRKAVAGKTTEINVEGINFAVDNDLISSLPRDVSIEQLFTDALARDVDRKSLIDQLRGKEILVVQYDRSANVAEDHLGNGVIGVNKALARETKNDIVKVLLQTALIHELRHEAGEVVGVQDTPLNLERFEAEQVSKDVTLFFALASQAKVTPDLNQLTILTSVLNPDSPFLIQTVAQVARAFALGEQNPDINLALSRVGADLTLFDKVPNQEQVDIFSSLGGLEAMIQALQYPAIILDAERLEDPVQQIEFREYLNRLVSSLEERNRPELIRVYVTGLKEVTPEALELKLAEVGLAEYSKRIEPVVIVRQEDETETSYATRIAKEVKQNKEQDLRFFVSEVNSGFYEQVTRLIGFVNTLFTNTQNVEIRMSTAEYNLILDALRKMNTSEALELINSIENSTDKSNPNERILSSAEVFVNSEYLKALELARRTLAIQA